jgi:hypothetical protein
MVQGAAGFGLLSSLRWIGTPAERFPFRMRMMVIREDQVFCGGRMACREMVFEHSNGPPWKGG